MAPLCIQEENVFYNSDYGEDESSLDDSSSSSFGGSRSVSFSEEATVRDIIHVDDYSPSEKSDCWYGKEEKRRIRREAKRAVSRMNDQTAEGGGGADHDDEEEELCTRGLEGQTRA